MLLKEITGIVTRCIVRLTREFRIRSILIVLVSKSALNVRVVRRLLALVTYSFPWTVAGCIKLLAV